MARRLIRPRGRPGPAGPCPVGRCCTIAERDHGKGETRPDERDQSETCTQIDGKARRSRTRTRAHALPARLLPPMTHVPPGLAIRLYNACAQAHATLKNEQICNRSLPQQHLSGPPPLATRTHATTMRLRGTAPYNPRAGCRHRARPAGTAWRSRQTTLPNMHCKLHLNIQRL